MKRLLTFVCLLTAPCCGALSQNFSCNYYGTAVNERVICSQFGYRSTTEAVHAVEEIVRRSGLKQNFYVMECPAIDNCFAATKNGERLIVYDAAFMAKINNLTKTDWAAQSILAHEIGHHLQGHTLKAGGSDPRKELEADEFSGFVMYQLGATLKESQSAIWKLTSDHDTGTHPGRTKRLAAIAKGYNAAKELYPQIQTPVDKKVTEDAVTNSEPVIYEESTRDVEHIRSGCIAGNCTNGYGTAINRYTKERYAGNWSNGQREGKGIEFYDNGARKYEGLFINGKYEGLGKYYFKNGDRYEGYFKSGDMHGEASNYVYKNGIKLSVNYISGRKEGKGLMVYPDGSRRAVWYRNDNLIR